MRVTQTVAALLVLALIAGCDESDTTSALVEGPSFNFENAPDNTGVVVRWDNVPQGLSFSADGYRAWHGISPADACAGNWWNDPQWDFQIIENPADVENWVLHGQDVHIYIWPWWADCDYMLSNEPVAAGSGNFRGHAGWRDGIRYKSIWKAQGQLTAQTGQWVENPANGHWYSLTPRMTWAEAEAKAVSWGAHLVAVNNQEEEVWVKDTFGWGIHYWIGFNDIEEEGNWVWTSGEPVTYTNWSPSEPNNCGGIDEFGQCIEEDVAQNVSNQGDLWNDVPDTECCWTRGIMERTTTPAGEKIHYNGRASWNRDARGGWHVNYFIKLEVAE